MLNVECRAIGSVGRHRFYNIGDSKDLRLQQDVGFEKSSRISRPIEALMMLENDLSNRQWECDCLKNVVGHLEVSLNHEILDL